MADLTIGDHIVDAIKWPVVLADSGDVFFVHSLNALQERVEPVDVDVYEGFDATGRRLVLSVSGSKILIHVGVGADPERLSMLLRTFLQACRHEARPSATLDELLASALGVSDHSV